MNFSRFDYLSEQDTRLKECIHNCKKAEQNARLNPANTAIYARVALENLLIAQSHINQVKHQNLAQSIEENCKLLKDKSEEASQIANEIRKQGNNAVHPVTKRPISNADIFHLDAATEQNIALSIQLVKNLYDLLCIFYEKSDIPPFNEQKIPFGDFYIIRKLNNPNESVSESYFVKHRNGFPVYYLQCLTLAGEQALENRREEATKRIYEQASAFGSRLCVPDLTMQLPEGSDRKLVAYRVNSSSFLLSELSGPMTLKQALKAGLDITDALLELKQLGMHHRNIYPASILMEGTAGMGYQFRLLDLQTCKIIGSNTTINTFLVPAYERNIFLPPHLRSGNRAVTDWEKVDVYTLCRVVLFCLHPKLANATSTGALKSHAELKTKPSLLQLYDNLFKINPTMVSVPNLNQLKEIFQDAYNKLP